MRIWLASAVLAACGPSDRDPGATDAPSQSDTAGSGSDGTVVDDSRVYAHSGGMLYRVNNATLEAQPIGPMPGLDPENLLDLAIDKSDSMVGITRDKLYSIDPQTGTPTLIEDLSVNARGLTSLSYAPQDLSDPNSADVLVAANDQGDVFSITAGSGTATATKIGSYGTAAGGKVVSSGDLIAVRGFGIFATVDVGSGTEDFLATIDPVTWKATPLPNPTGFDHIFGLGFWNGVIYGFVDDGFEAATGRMVTIDPQTGRASLANAGTIRWFGAGVSTSAPIL